MTRTSTDWWMSSCKLTRTKPPNPLLSVSSSIWSSRTLCTLLEIASDSSTIKTNITALAKSFISPRSQVYSFLSFWLLGTITVRILSWRSKVYLISLRNNWFFRGWSTGSMWSQSGRKSQFWEKRNTRKCLPIRERKMASISVEVFCRLSHGWR